MKDQQIDFLLAVAGRLAPGSRDLDAAGRGRFAAIVRSALADKPPRLVFQLGLFMGVVRWLPVLRYGRPFDALPGESRDAVLAWFMSNPVPLIRKGFWGLKSLAYMGYYGQHELAEGWGYRPSRDGNSKLRVR